MVVVVHPQETDAKMKKYVGNNMTLNLVGNKKKVLVVGNNCSVKIKDNEWIKIVGDNCTLEVASGGGGVTYIGNNGAIYLDQSVDEDVVTYVGNNGTVTKNGTIKRHCSDSDVRNCGGSVNVVNVDGQCNISVSGLSRTRVSAKKLTKIASTISLPNIQIHLTGHKKRETR